MGAKGLRAFEEALATDKALVDNYQAVVEQIIASGDAGSETEIVVKAAAELGYDVSLEELERALAGVQELDEAELDSVAGGDPRYCTISDTCDEFGHDNTCVVFWHCYAAFRHTDAQSQRVDCWEDYICLSDHYSYDPKPH